MTDITSTRESSPRPKRSWRRFTLRALFLVTLIAAICFGSVAHRLRCFREQATFLAVLRSHGFRIETEPVVHAWFWRALAGDNAVQVKSARLIKSLPGGRWIGPPVHDLKRIAMWDNIKWLQLYGPNVTDETIESVSTLRALESLMLYDTPITARALETLASLPALTSFAVRADETFSGDLASAVSLMPHLRHLEIEGALIDNRSLRTLVLRLPGLTTLNLTDCNIGDDGLQHVMGLRKLKQLWLRENPKITDAGLQFIAQMPQLSSLDVSQTGITRQGVERFLAAMETVHLVEDASRVTRLFEPQRPMAASRN